MTNKNAFVEFQDRVFEIGGHFAYSDKCRYDKIDIPNEHKVKYAAFISNEDGTEKYSVTTIMRNGDPMADAVLYLKMPDIPLKKVTWENIKEVYRDWTEDRIFSEVDVMITEGMLNGVSTDGTYYIENYEPGELKLSDKNLDYILTNGEEFRSFWSAYYSILDQMLFDNCNWTSYESGEIKKDVLSHLTKDAMEIVQFPDFDLDEYLQERICFSFRPEDWNQTLKINLLIDSGNWNYDCNCDDLLNPAQPKERLQYSSVAYVAELVGQRKELYSALAGESVKDNSFLDSVFEELDNCTYPNGSTMTFLVTLSLHELLDLLDARLAAKKEESCKTKIKISKDTMCGLFNTWNGSGSLLGIELPTELTIPVDKVEVQIDSLPGNGYSVGATYGLVSSAWKKAGILTSPTPKDMGEVKSKK